jgi:hypothetical protein
VNSCLAADVATQAWHVIVDRAPGGPWYTHDWIWVAAGSLVSAGVALATFRLARFTKALADRTAELSIETRESVHAAQNAITAEERRHRDSLQPHVAIALTAISVSEGLKGYPGNKRMSVTNIGPGYASNMRFDIVYNGENEDVDPLYSPAGALGANQSRDVLIGFTAKQLEQFVVMYEDAFRSRYESRMVAPYLVGSPYEFRRVPDSPVATDVNPGFEVSAELPPPCRDVAISPETGEV